MIFGKHTELGSKRNRAFCAGGYYVLKAVKIIEDAIKRYM